MWMFDIRQRQRRKASQRRLVKECEAFLTSEFAESSVPAGEPVPVWAWINLLAHGTEEQLRREVIMPAGSDNWHRARSLLAARLFANAAAGGTSLAEIQRDVLVPLELEMISSRTVDRWDPPQLVIGVLGALSDRDRRGAT
jgi:hypothetical protein